MTPNEPSLRQSTALLEVEQWQREGIKVAGIALLDKVTLVTRHKWMVLKVTGIG